MDRVETYRQIICETLSEYVQLKYANAEIENEAVFDRNEDHYLVISIGWQGVKRIHGVLIHIDIISNKVWVQRDGTEFGIAKDLVKKGIPKSDIVLGFHSPEIRQHTDYATV
jgi:hypothetical protein